MPMGVCALDEVRRRNITEIRNAWAMMGENARGEFLDLSAPSPIYPRHRDLWSADAAEAGCSGHALSHVRPHFSFEPSGCHATEDASMPEKRDRNLMRSPCDNV